MKTETQKKSLFCWPVLMAVSSFQAVMWSLLGRFYWFWNSIDNPNRSGTELAIYAAVWECSKSISVFCIFYVIVAVWQTYQFPVISTFLSNLLFRFLFHSLILAFKRTIMGFLKVGVLFEMVCAILVKNIPSEFISSYGDHKNSKAFCEIFSTL